MTAEQPRASLITPPGEGGIGIIAVLGTGATDLLERVFAGTNRCAGEIQPGRMAHGTIRRDGRVLDEVILARLEGGPGPGGPRFEVNCHGGIAATRAVLARLREAGARVVEPDQLREPARSAPPLAPAALRRRALSLLKRAHTRLGASALLQQADGALSDELTEVAELLQEDRQEAALGRLEGLLTMVRPAAALLEPPAVGLMGPPNVGKSTLLNALLEEERVIVHPEPGTTRDVVAETVALRGVPLELLDSAGMRRATEQIEQRAVERAAAMAENCEVALLIFDAREGPRPLLALLPVLRPEARRIVIGNKVDLLPQPPRHDLPPALQAAPLLYISALKGKNLGKLESMLLEPYEELIQACRDGRGLPFDAEAAKALRELTEAVRMDGAEAAMELLNSLGAATA